jgi:hypothetical protein
VIAKKEISASASKFDVLFNSSKVAGDLTSLLIYAKDDFGNPILEVNSSNF